LTGKRANRGVLPGTISGKWAQIGQTVFFTTPQEPDFIGVANAW